MKIPLENSEHSNPKQLRIVRLLQNMKSFHHSPTSSALSKSEDIVRELYKSGSGVLQSNGLGRYLPDDIGPYLYMPIRYAKALTIQKFETWLPDEVWLTVFSYLEMIDLVTVSGTCHRFRDLARDDTVWWKHYESFFLKKSELYHLFVVNPNKGCVMGSILRLRELYPHCREFKSSDPIALKCSRPEHYFKRGDCSRPRKRTGNIMLFTIWRIWKLRSKRYEELLQDPSQSKKDKTRITAHRTASKISFKPHLTQLLQHLKKNIKNTIHTKDPLESVISGLDNLTLEKVNKRDCI